jgi:hypothetical protein
VHAMHLRGARVGLNDKASMIRTISQTLVLCLAFAHGTIVDRGICGSRHLKRLARKIGNDFLARTPRGAHKPVMVRCTPKLPGAGGDYLAVIFLGSLRK